MKKKYLSYLEILNGPRSAGLVRLTEKFIQLGSLFFQKNLDFFGCGGRGLMNSLGKVTWGCHGITA